jgi:hypothetical protein
MLKDLISICQKFEKEDQNEKISQLICSALQSVTKFFDQDFIDFTVKHFS